ncbi:hypothetical protein PWT90_06457 [Aphanocladium album]|nr:hypothetical protein PWT90_06457 [Aphanocladium album]
MRAWAYTLNLIAEGLAKFVATRLRLLVAKYMRIMTSTSKRRICDASSQQSVEPNKRTFLAHGSTGIVYAIDEYQVSKEYYDAEEGAEERRALERLGSHPNIIRYFGTGQENSIILERGIPLLALSDTAGISIQSKEAWITDIAEGLLHIHKNNIIHGDIGCENMVIVDDRVKIIDFEGCGIDGEDSAAAYKWYNRRESSADTQSDIFAYGCAIYQILTGKPTFFDLVDCDDREKVARRLWAEGRFPDVRGLRLASVMLGCWSGEFHCMEDVIAAMDSMSGSRSANTCIYSFAHTQPAVVTQIVALGALFPGAGSSMTSERGRYGGKGDGRTETT